MDLPSRTLTDADIEPWLWVPARAVRSIGVRWRPVDFAEWVGEARVHLVRGLMIYDPEHHGPVLQAFLLVYVKRRVLDAMRTSNGWSRVERRQMIQPPLSLDHQDTLEDGDGNEWLMDSAWLAVEDPDPTDHLAELLRCCPTDRHRLIIERRLAGAPMHAIAAELGVTESRVSQLMKDMRGWYAAGVVNVPRAHC